MSGSLKRAELVEAGYFFTEDVYVNKWQRAAAKGAASRITYSVARLDRARWHKDPTSRYERGMMLAELEGNESSLGRVSLSL
jgi:hypothetical protein